MTYLDHVLTAAAATAAAASEEIERAPIFDPARQKAWEILNLVMQYRRAEGSHPVSCPACHSPHLPKVLAAVRAGAPVRFVLPAFPGKSPNQAKVLGALPDLAERLSLQFLQRLCERIQDIYAPGAEILLCSDGRVFSDVVGMAEADVTAYQAEIDRMIESLALTHLSTFHLDQWRAGSDFGAVRTELMETFGAPLVRLQEKVRNGAKPLAFAEETAANQMYRGITRFLVEDSTFPGQTLSRTAVQKECKTRAYEVILRSNAWSGLIAKLFPEAVRLSIHPQACGAEKLGIRLVGNENWITPWHGVALKTAAGFTLVKRHEAEALNARLVTCAEGRPSHFEMESV